MSPTITPEYLESVGTPSLFTPAPDIVSIMSGDCSETVDMTWEQFKELTERMKWWVSQGEKSHV